MSDRWVIEIVVDADDGRRVYDAVERMLVEMGEIGTLSSWRRTRAKKTVRVGSLAPAAGSGAIR